MEKILSDVSTPNWWFSVIFAGLVVSLLGNFLSAFIKNKLDLSIKKYAENSHIRKKEDTELIEKLKSDKTLFLIFIANYFLPLRSVFLLAISGLSIGIMPLLFIELRENSETLTDEEQMWLLFPPYLAVGVVALMLITKMFSAGRSTKIIYTVLRHYFKT